MSSHCSNESQGIASMHRMDEIIRYYSKWWENPKDIRNIVFESLNELVRKRIPKGNGKRALDIGSGKGRIVSYLLEKSYKVTAVEINPDFVCKLKKNFPQVKVIQEDICNVSFNERFDLITMIEVAQNFNKEELVQLLRKVNMITRILFINISNKNSLHGLWIESHKFKNNFVHRLTPGQFDAILNSTGFNIYYRKGVGLVTPLSLFSGFRGRLIPIWLAKAVNRRFDKYATRFCHLYYVEARSLRKSLEETQAER